MTIEEFQEIHQIIIRLKAKEYQIAYSKTDGYSIITKDYKHVRFITKEEYEIIERLVSNESVKQCLTFKNSII